MEKEGDDQKLKHITCVRKGLIWIGEADGEENRIELLERRMILMHEALSLDYRGKKRKLLFVCFCFFVNV